MFEIGTDKERLYYVMSPIHEQGSRDYLPVDNTRVVLREVIAPKNLLTVFPR